MPDKEEIHQMFDARVQATLLRLPLESRSVSLPDVDRLRGQLDRLIRTGAEKTAVKPDRFSEAQRNLDYLLHEIEEQVQAHGITARTVSDIMSRPCPMWPFC